jgi:PAS domain S-box-containing protein
LGNFALFPVCQRVAELAAERGRRDGLDVSRRHFHAKMFSHVSARLLELSLGAWRGRIVQTLVEHAQPASDALDRLTRLQALTAALAQALTANQVADIIISQGLAVLGATAGSIYLLSADGAELVNLRLVGYSEEVANAWRRFSVNLPLPLCDAARQGQPIFLLTITERSRRYPELAHIPCLQGEGAVVALPMVIQGRVIGCMGMRFGSERSFPESDRAFMLALVSMCAQALERARLYDGERAARAELEQALTECTRAEAARAQDVAERKSAEEGAKRFKFISDHANDAHFFIDREARFLYVNRRTVELLGYAEDELLQMGVPDIDPSFPRERYQQLFDRLFREERIPTFETTVVRKDGRSLPIELSLTGMVFGGQRFEFAVARDITERKRAMEALRESEERLRTLSDNLPDGAIYQGVVDAEGRGSFTYFSAGVERLFGVSAEEIKQDPLVLYSLIHDDDRERMMTTEAAALRNLTPFDCEFRQWTRGGELRWVHCRSAPRRLPDGGAVWDGVLLDVTERRRAAEALRQSQERFRRLFDAGIVGVGVSDADGNWIEGNDELLRIIGYSREELTNGMVRWIDMTPSHFLPLDVQGILEARMRGACTPYEKEYLRKDGSVVPVLIGFATLAEGHDRFICFVLDLTAQKRVEAALREADRRKDEFLAVLAHELRNPLAPIRNALAILETAGMDGAIAERARVLMERQVHHLVRLVDDLLDVSRVMRGKIDLRREQVELAAVVARALETAHPLLEAQGHALDVSLPPESLVLEADPVRLTQVVGNLLANAAKYTESGGRITLEVQREGDQAILRVRDTGIGIDPEVLPRIFELFVQANHAVTRSQGGLGIGLTLVKSLVELHHGTVEAHSAGPGKGSEFVVALPLLSMTEGGRMKDDEEAFPLHLATSGRGGTEGLPLSRRILVVDDNEDVAESLAMLLRLSEHHVRVAHSGPAALELAKGFRPEVVFLDIGMPGMDGNEVARCLRQQPGLDGVALVALTGWGAAEDRRRSAAAGFDHHLVKPVEPGDLHTLLAELEL